MAREKLTDEAFIVMWTRAWREGKTLNELSTESAVAYHALVNRFRSLMLIGIALPALSGMLGAQPKTAVRAEKLKQLLANLMSEPAI